MCRAANTPSTTAQQKAATTPKLMNTMAATSWKQRWERLGRGRTFQRPPRSGPESLQSPVAPPRGPRLEPHGTSPGSSPGTPRHLPWVLTRNPTAPPLGPCLEPHGTSPGSLPGAPQGSRPEPCGSSAGSSPPTMAAGDPPRWLGCPTSARPTRPLACFTGHRGAGTQELSPHRTASWMSQGPPEPGRS